MHHFFLKEEALADGLVRISGEDYRHAVNVLRLQENEHILVSDASANDYECAVARIDQAEKVLYAEVLQRHPENHELPCRVMLFQGIPKADKMEFIIQKAVELGVSDIVPVRMKNCVVKLDEQKAEKRQKRWQAIAESAANQCKRSIIPRIFEPVGFVEAVRLSETADVRFLPYENAEGMQSLCETMLSLRPGTSIAVFIGPEGGFDPLEAKHAQNKGVIPVSLGKRILRTETAALAALSIIMIRLEIAAWQEAAD